MSSTTEQIKERLGIVDVVSSYLKLEKAGKNFRARCPFHNEKTPSFLVSPERDSYHCFGCSKGGDIFNFVEEIEGVDFRGALKVLAERAGVELSSFNSQEETEKEKLYRVMETATLYYNQQLGSHSGAVQYLKERGLTDKTLRDFRVGFALNEWRSIFAFLRTEGFHESIMEKAGLIIRASSGPAYANAMSGRQYYDRFRERIMFPIMDSSGRVVAFSGRVFPAQGGSLPAGRRGASGGSDEKTAKYINSPETVLYNKSDVLYGFDKAKMAIRQAGACVFVEGQIDLLMSHQAGVTNTVAVSGTALTREHLLRAARLTENFIFAFDADDAGISAAGKGAYLALSLGLNVRLVSLPQGVDPALMISRDKDAWISRVRSAQHIIDFYLNTLKESGYEASQFRREISKHVLPFIASIRGRIEQAHFVARTAKVLGVREDAIWDELRSTTVNNVIKPEIGKAVVQQIKKTRRKRIEEELAWVTEEEARQDLENNLKEEILKEDRDRCDNEMRNAVARNDDESAKKSQQKSFEITREIQNLKKRTYGEKS